MQLHMKIFYPLEFNCDCILYNNIIFVKYEKIPLVSMWYVLVYLTNIHHLSYFIYQDFIVYKNEPLINLTTQWLSNSLIWSKPIWSNSQWFNIMSVSDKFSNIPWNALKVATNQYITWKRLFLECKALQVLDNNNPKCIAVIYDIPMYYCVDAEVLWYGTWWTNTKIFHVLTYFIISDFIKKSNPQIQKFSLFCTLNKQHFCVIVAWLDLGKVIILERINNRDSDHVS